MNRNYKDNQILNRRSFNLANMKIHGKCIDPSETINGQK